MFARLLPCSVIIALLVPVGCRTPSAAEPSAATVLDHHESGVPAQVHRFDAWLNILIQTVEGADDYESAAKKLIGGENRIASFNLQALGRLYEADDEMFKKMRKNFKQLEDGIGEYDKWDKVLAKATENGASSSVINNLKDKRKKAKKDLEEMLKEEGYRGDEPRLSKYAEKVRAYAWPDYSTDKAAVLGRIAAELDEIGSLEWDFSRLEEGNGVHELRRKLRWFLIEARVLNGLVLLKPLDSACPTSVYADLPSQPIASSKYGKLPPSPIEIAPHSITPCLFLALVNMVEEIGRLKDQSEVDNNSNDGDAGDTVDPEIQAKIEALYQEMIDTEVLTTLSAELREGIPQ